MLEIEEISKRAAGGTILDRFSCRVGAGETVAVLGPSGAGKTTLLRLLAGLEAPDSGSIRVGGQEFSRGRDILVPPERRGIVLAFQDTALFPHLTVEGNVGFGLSRLAKGLRQARVEEELERFGISALRTRGVTSLSGGELQRVSLARALAVRPEILLLDEPFSNVDRLVRIDLIRCLRKIFTERRMTVLLVTHDARDALELADSVLVLRGGKKVAAGALLELAGGDDPWVKAFLSTGLSS